MTARANGVIDGFADVIGPVGVEPAAQTQFERLSTLGFCDFHGCLMVLKTALNG
jgi:hypothetical protein